jgi:PAS domain S-box-containing protein
MRSLTKSIWRNLTEPAISIQESEQRRRAQLLSALLIPLLLATLLGALYEGEQRWPLFGSFIVLSITYGLSRTRYYILASALSVAILSAPSFVLVLSDTDYSPINVTARLLWIALSLALGGLVFSFRGSAITCAANIGGILLLPVLLPDLTFGAIVASVSFISIISILALLAGFIRAQHLAQIERQSKELRTSEGRYRLISELISDYAYSFRIEPDGSTALEWITEAFEHITGYAPKDAIVLGWEQLRHPDDAPIIQERLQKRLLGEVTDTEFRIIRKDGTVRWVRDISRPEWDAKEGRVIRIVGATTDITDSKLAEEALRKLSRAVEQSPATVVITDLKGNIEYINPKFTELTGYTSEEAIGQNPRILKSDDIPPEDYKRLWDTITSGGEWRGEFHNKKKNGELYWEYASISPIRDASGTITHFLAVKEDITERKRAEESLRESEERYRVLFDESPIGIALSVPSENVLTLKDAFKPVWIFDHATHFRNSQVLMTNDAFDQLCGYSREEINQIDPYAAYLNAEDRDHMLAQLKRDGSVKNFEIIKKRKDNTIYYASTTILPFPMAGKGALLLMEMDITERKQVEQTLQHYAERLTMLHQIDRSILRADTPQTIAQAAVKQLQAIIPCDQVGVSLFDLEAGELQILALQATGTPVLEIGTQHPLNEEWLAQLLQNETWLIADMQALANATPIQQRVREQGYNSSVSIRLMPQNKLIGALYLLSRKSNAFSRDEIEVAREVADQIAIAIHQSQLLADNRQRAEELDTLRRVTLDITAQLDLDKVLNTVVKNAMTLLGADGGGIYLHRPERNVLERVVSVGGGMSPPGSELQRGQGVSGKVWETGQPLIVDDYSTWEGRNRNYDTFVTRAVIGAPIFWGDDFLGVINAAMFDRSQQKFTKHQAQLLDLLAHQAAVAIHNAGLYEREQHARHVAENLRETGLVISSSLDLQQVLDFVLNQLANVVPHDTSVIELLRDDNLIIIAKRGLLAEATTNEERISEFPLDKYPFNKRMILGKTPQLIADLHDDPDWQIIDGHEALRCAMILPLIARDEMIGLLNIFSYQVGGFGEQEMQIAATFGQQAAAAIQNARFYEQSQHHTIELEERVAERTAELKTANQELQILSQAKDEFVSDVSHELRTPIASLKIRHYMLSRQPEKLPYHLSVIERETNRLEGLINNLLILSRVDQGRLTFEMVAVDLNALVQEYVNDRTPVAEEKGLALFLGDTPNIPAVTADRELLGQVLSILLTNALNYTPPGGQIRIGTQTSLFDERQWAGFSVGDTGPGISLKDQEKLFTRFFRGDAGRSSNTPGTGLGLAIANEIINRHHGRISVESEGIPGKGTRFHIWLPIKPSKD